MQILSRRSSWPTHSICIRLSKMRRSRVCAGNINKFVPNKALSYRRKALWGRNSYRIQNWSTSPTAGRIWPHPKDIPVYIEWQRQQLTKNNPNKDRLKGLTFSKIPSSKNWYHWAWSYEPNLSMVPKNGLDKRRGCWLSTSYSSYLLHLDRFRSIWT